VLDIACGTGAVTRLAAAKAADGRVVGIDLNAGMLAVARTVPKSGAPIEWLEGSALDLPFPALTFDVVLCQLGLQFFPDQSLALREMSRVLKVGGRIGLSVYSAIERTPAAYAFVQALDKNLGPDASKTKRAEHAHPDPHEVHNLISAAGFQQAKVETVTKQISFPSMLDYVRFQLIATPMAGLLKDRSAADRDEHITKIAADAEAYCDRSMLRDGHLTFPQESQVATAIR
jgi:ubiquinone/menaquinone biosynthesis C-methylase UbiE